MADYDVTDDTTDNSVADDAQIREGDSLITPLAEDNATPFSAPDDAVQDATLDVDVRTEQGQLDPTHQSTDDATDIDPVQFYNEGLAGAAEDSEPNAGNTVVDYHPENDQRKQEK
ncbi:MAG: hypothetical protein JWM81_841 [Candidatus Saccharibacteria bacterium]|nr:hypothetical protein [Candidatus Saccharibacteria bacterium]